MEIQQLKGFLAVARHLGFSAASKSAGRTQSALSLQVKALEEELGVKLFERIGTRKLVVTAEGRALVEMAAPIVEELESLGSRFAEACGRSTKANVRIATHASVMTYLLPEAVRQFRKQHPDCELSIVGGDRRKILTLVREGEVDFGISSVAEAPRGLEYRAFAKFKRLLIASAGHSLAGKKTVTIDEIARFPLIVAPKGSATREVVEAAFAEKGLELKVAMEVTGREAIKEYVGMGLGISIVNEYYMKDKDQKKLRVTDVSRYFGQAERGVVTRKGKYLSPGARGFLRLLKVPR